MKRFNAEMWSDSYMDESPTGKYVLYEDMVKLLAEKDALLVKALQIIKFDNSRNAELDLAKEIMDHGINLPKHKAVFQGSNNGYTFYEVYEFRGERYSFVGIHSGVDEQSAISQYLTDKKTRKSI